MDHVPEHPFVISPILIRPTCATCRLTEADGECGSEYWEDSDEPFTCDPDDFNRAILIDRLTTDYPTIGDLIESAAVAEYRPRLDFDTLCDADNPVDWYISKYDSQKWTYRHYDAQTRQYRRLSPGEIAPSSPCLMVLSGVQDLILDTAPNILLFPYDLAHDLEDARGVRNWTDADAPEARELVGHRLIDLTEDGRGCYFDLTGYVHLGYYEDPQAIVFCEYDIYVRIPSNSKSARSAR